MATTNYLNERGHVVFLRTATLGQDQRARLVKLPLDERARMVWLPVGGIGVPDLYDVFAELGSDGALRSILDDWRPDPGVTMFRGKEHALPLAPPAAAKMTFVLSNRTGTYSPSQSSLVYGRRTRFQVLTPGDPGAAETAVWGGYADELVYNPSIGVQDVTVQSLGILSKFVNAEKQYTQLYSSKRVDECLGLICDAIGIPASLRVFDTANTTLDWWWMNGEDPWEAALSLIHTEGAGATLYEDTQGRLVFKKRRARITDTASATSQSTFYGHYIAATPLYSAFTFDDGKKLAGNFCGYVTKKRTAKTLAQVWNYGSSLVLAANETRLLTVTASDPFTAAATPVGAGTDYTVSVGSLVSISLSRTSGQTTVLTIVAGGSGATVVGPAGVLGIQVRAQAVTVDSTTEVDSQVDVTTSVARYGKQTINIKPRAEVPTETAQILVDDYVRWYTNGRPTISVVLRSAYGNSDTNRLQQLNRDLGDRITIVEDYLPLTADVWIEGIRQRVLPGGVLETTFICEQTLEGLGFGPWYFTLTDDSAAGTLTWSNPTSAALADSIYANATNTGGSTATTHYIKGLLVAQGRVPTTGTVTGVKLEVTRRSRSLSIGPTFGSTFASSGGDPQPETAWTNPSNAQTEDGVFATSAIFGTGYNTVLGPLIPASRSSVNDGAGEVAWTNPTNAGGEDGVYATSVLYGRNFGSAPQNTPGTAANNQSSIGWTGATNVYADDANFATATIGGMTHTTDWLEVTGFGFTIPTNATITGIIVDVYGRQSDAAHRGKLFVALLNGGGTATNKSNAISDSLVNTIYGSSSDLWGTTWTPSQVNSGSFKARIWFEQDNVDSNDVAIGSVKITVSWNRASGPDGPRAPGTTANVAHGAGSWSNVSNVAAEDGSLASITLSPSGATIETDYLFATNYGFSLPTEAVILGLLIEAKASANVTGSPGLSTLLGVTKSGTTVVNSTAVFPPGSPGWVTFGGATDLLGTTWTPAEVNASGFGAFFLGVASGSGTVTWAVDQIRVTVYWKVDPQLAGPTYTTSATTTNSTPVWTNPNNGRAADSSPATSALGAAAIQSDFLDLTNLGFAIPTDATIKGITVYVSAAQSAWSADPSLSHGGKLNAVLLTGDANEQKNYTPTSGLGYVGLGSASNLWNVAWTPTTINSTSFGVRLWLHQTDNTTNNLQIDGILVEVTYTLAGRNHTEQLRVVNPGFTVPSGATILGVQVAVKAGRSASFAQTGHAQLVLDVAGTPTPSGTTKTIGSLNVGSPTWQYLGDSTEKWGLALTQAQVNAGNFGVQVSFDHSDDSQGANTFSVDAIWITVYYAPSGTNQTEWLTMTNMGLSLPTNAAILGIEARVKAKHSDASIGNCLFALVVGGSRVSQKFGTQPPQTTAAFQTVGGSTDLWGQTLTATQLNASTFGIAVLFTNAQPGAGFDTYSVDQLLITVWYAPRVVDKEVKLIKGGSAVGTNLAATTTPWPADTAAVATYGGPTNMWGTTITPAEANAATFGARLSADIEPGGFADIDEMRQFIYYTTPT